MTLARTGWALLTAVLFAACGGARGPSSGMGSPVSDVSTPTMSSPREYAERPISAEAGADYFLRTGGGDPYATGLAYPLFLALMDRYPDELGRDFAEFSAKFGFIPDPEKGNDPKAVPIGFHLTVDPNTNVPWLVGNCRLCHADRLRLESGDVVVDGLGNKKVRVHAYADALVRIGLDPKLDVDDITARATKRSREWGVAWPDAVRRPIVLASLEAFKAGAKKRAAAANRLASALPGRVATIEGFAMAFDDHRAVPITMPDAIGWTKVPDVRSFPFRDTFSYDASGYGSPQALVLDADFIFGARPEWHVSHPHIATSTYLYLKSFSRRLPFPKPVDTELAQRGKTSFEAHCAHCHGTYVEHGRDMRVSYRERVIPKDVVGTDPARADAVTPSYVDAANANFLVRGYARVRSTGGYVPPVLLDVWARGLYGHAGQWPSLEVLATAPADRPRAFVVDTDGLYDLDRVGVRYEVPRPGPPRAQKPSEYRYEGSKLGFFVDGHPFLSDLPTGERKAVIEYLKTLTSK